MDIFNKPQAIATYTELLTVDGFTPPEGWFDMLSTATSFYVRKGGYVMVRFDSTRELLHRIVMDCPSGLCVDHIDRNPLNNSLSNLRIVTIAENNQNKGLLPSNTSGVEGVSWDRRSRTWSACLYVEGKKHRKKFKVFDDAVKYREHLELTHLRYNKNNRKIVTKRVDNNYYYRFDIETLELVTPNDGDVVDCSKHHRKSAIIKEYRKFLLSENKKKIKQAKETLEASPPHFK